MHIDFLGPLTQTLNGNSYVGLAVCALTKYVEAAGKIANTKLTFFSIKIPLRFKPTTTGGASQGILVTFCPPAVRNKDFLAQLSWHAHGISTKKGRGVISMN